MLSKRLHLTSPYDNHDILHSQEINESILNHLFLFHGLSSSAYADYLIQSNHENEYKILECMNEYFQSLDTNNELPILSIIKTCTERWSIIQNTKNCSVLLLQSTIQKLSSDWQKSIEKNQKENIVKLQLNLDPQEIYHHSCEKLKAYLNKKHSNTLNKQFYNRYAYNHRPLTRVVHEDDGLPRVSVLTNHEDDAMGTALIRIEIWVESCLEQWINRSLLSKNGYKGFENLQSFYEDYQCAALDFYYGSNQSTDSIGYSRFILTSLTMIRLMHMKLCEDTRFKRLKVHAIRIPHLMNLFEYLVLPNQDDMIRARDVYDYFLEFNEKPYPDVLSNIDSQNTFGIHFAKRSEEINKNLQKIQEQSEQDKKDKIEEINNAKEKYEELMKKVNDLECECELKYIFYRKCNRCTMKKEAENIKVDIYECPIPSERRSALAVMFELQMPNEIRCYRDILWQFVNRAKPNPSHNMHEWLRTSPHQNKLGQYFKNSHNCKVKLVSATKSITESHYSAPRHVMSTSMEEYFYDNGLQIQISPTKIIDFQDECRILTPKLIDSNYKDLEFSIDNIEFVQNRVIAELSKCSLKLKSAEFVEFGSFRSGHRLQWWNLLSILELDSLSMDEESVVILITHALLQYGPVTKDRKSLICSWCPESHEQLLEDHFVDELITRLDRHLKDCECNWQNELMLVIITVIVMRIFTICNSTRKDHMMHLVLKCRKIGGKWIELISKTIQNPSSSDSDNMNALRDKIVIIGITNLLTYSIYSDSSNNLVLSNQDVISLLTIATTIHDNNILNKKTVHMSVFMRNLMRYSEYVLLSIHPIISKLLQESSYESLNEFCVIHWAVVRTNGVMHGNWKERSTDTYDGWYDGEYESNKLSIDCLRGGFFVNKMTISFLPDRITSNDLFRRVFGQHIFEVQAAESEDSYITKHEYHADGKVHYEFTYDNGYYGNHHWWNENRKILEFRPCPFGQVQAIKKSDDDHQIVTIERKSTSFIHEYFVFILNDRLRILQPTDSPTSWLYLALLHAMTSHPLPDQYTEMTDYLYGSGDVNLKDSEALRCFPLSRWLKDDYQLKNIWIGLFKFGERLKTVESDHKKDDIERFEMLLDFLHYISSKCSSEPFYLQMLKSILKAPTLPLGSISYPSFTQYTNIQESSFQSYRINLGKMGRYKRNIVLQEIQDCFVKNFRIIVLKALFPMNFQSLRYKSGGLLNRRVMPFACRRDMNFNDVQVNKIFDCLKQGLHNLDIVLTSPEDILSFDLLTTDKCRRNEVDVDESNETLHVKYQLIYSIGRQQQVDGGIERWKTIQYVLNLVKQHAANIAQQYNEDVFYKESERQIDQFPHNTIQLFLIMRGRLSSEVLFVGLKKRCRVNFGVNQNTKFNPLMAVPFRAKDVAVENIEFGHPDVVILLTQISYYYKGLTDLQMRQCFDRLTQDESDWEMIYDQWISLEEENDKIAKAQQFPNKLVASAWDLSSSLREKIITGFSGTNDTQLLLPVHIRQCDLPELQKKDAIVLNTLLRPENDHY
ncbi:unnamed protein product [Didymodactylos carnosus]|uniref:ubiquitinyl hydrolase 1 n=1 Tax=Didymodactylos carnosus TaxID=1234261 RepID=A0A8S2DU34_9BILA|nr:unnamed protein product [Didymodactylos carnosus]CAF3818506.1 unnamed protein product [Didymodactylos carnosus]